VIARADCSRLLSRLDVRVEPGRANGFRLVIFPSSLNIGENQLMLRRSILILGIGFLFAVLMLVLAPLPGHAQGPAQTAAHDNQLKAEAEVGHEAAAASHAAEGEGKSNPMEPQPALAIWTVVVFLGLFWVLRRYSWKPLSEALHQREEHGYKVRKEEKKVTEQEV